MQNHHIHSCELLLWLNFVPNILPKSCVGIRGASGLSPAAAPALYGERGVPWAGGPQGLSQNLIYGQQALSPTAWGTAGLGWSQQCYSKEELFLQSGRSSDINTAWSRTFSGKRPFIGMKICWEVEQMQKLVNNLNKWCGNTPNKIYLNESISRNLY